MLLGWQIPRLISMLDLSPTAARADDISWYEERRLAFMPLVETDTEPPRPGEGLLLLGRAEESNITSPTSKVPSNWTIPLAFSAAIDGRTETSLLDAPAAARPTGLLTFDPSLTIVPVVY